jgi:hypothetical protein
MYKTSITVAKDMADMDRTVVFVSVKNSTTFNETIAQTAMFSHLRENENGGGSGGDSNLPPTGTTDKQCEDTPPNWTDAAGDGCDWYDGQCNEYGNWQGEGQTLSANDACCVCGGGSDGDKNTPLTTNVAGTPASGTAQLALGAASLVGSLLLVIGNMLLS